MAEEQPEAGRAAKMIELLASDFSSANKGAMKQVASKFYTMMQTFVPRND